MLQPYRMVKDHRTGETVGDADSVLDGAIDPFLEAFLKGKIASPDDRDAAARPAPSQLFPRSTAVAKRSAPR